MFGFVGAWDGVFRGVCFSFPSLLRRFSFYYFLISSKFFYRKKRVETGDVYEGGSQASGNGTEDSKGSDVELGGPVDVQVYTK